MRINSLYVSEKAFHFSLFFNITVNRHKDFINAFPKHIGFKTSNNSNKYPKPTYSQFKVEKLI